MKVGEIRELVQLQKDYKEIYFSTGLCGIDAQGVHLTAKEFKQTFKEYETSEHSEDSDKISTVYEGVVFYALTEKVPTEAATSNVSTSQNIQLQTTPKGVGCQEERL